MDETRIFSPLKLALSCVVAAISLNFLLRVLFKFEGVSITMLIAGCVAGFALLWVVKVVQRPPTNQERSRFLLLYSGILAFTCLVIASLAAINGTLNTGGIIILIVHYLVYPFFALTFFSEKQFASIFKKQ